MQLYFAKCPLQGKSDPNELLKGGGKAVRYVALGSAADLDRPEFALLMAAALELAKLHPDAGTEGSVIIETGGQEQRASLAWRAVASSALRTTRAACSRRCG